MFSIRAAGVVLTGGLLLGCHSGNVTNPNASAPLPTDQQTAAALVRSWQSTHPGARAGVVDAVLPARRDASIADLPANEIQDGTIITILDERQQTLVSGVVYDRRGSDVHIQYQALAGGQRDPRVGDMAVWFPGGGAVTPDMMQPGTTAQGGPTTQPAGARMEGMPAATQPAIAPADNGSAVNGLGITPPQPPQNTPPATQPAGGADTTAPPATQPASGAGATGAPATGTRQAAPAELNK